MSFIYGFKRIRNNFGRFENLLRSKCTKIIRFKQRELFEEPKKNLERPLKDLKKDP